MIYVKTIIKPTCDVDDFDNEVNKALADGWELVRRDIITPPDESSKLYAELERYIEEEEEEPEDDGAAEWIVTRNPSAPYRCNKCGYSTSVPIHYCPGCERARVSYR